MTLKTSLLLLLLITLNQGAFALTELQVKVLDTKPHDPQSFTQGFVFFNGNIIESSGLYGRSFIQIYNANTNNPIAKTPLSEEIFAEGLALVNNDLCLLTWKKGILFRYDVNTLKLKRTQRYKGEGWGLTTVGNQLVMSNGTENLSFRDIHTFKETHSIKVTHNKKTIHYLNELEFDGTHIWANRWKSTDLYKISPDTGEVVGKASLQKLVPFKETRSTENVLNGIAYVPQKKAFWITGKRWPLRYLVQFSSL